MRRVFSFALALAIVLSLAACSRSAAATWQEQYDLGVRYLSEGNYREAIIAFNAAIEIDPKRAEAYIGLADAYEAQGDTEQARQVLEDALAAVSDLSAIQSRLDGLAEGAGPEPTESEEPTEHEPPTDEEAWSYISLEPDGDVPYVEETITLSEFEGPRTINGYSILSQETQLTVSNLAGVEDNCYIRIDIMFYGYEKETDRGNRPFPGNFYLTDEGEFEQNLGDNDNALKLRPGESVTFSLPSFGHPIGYPLTFLTLTLVYPDYEKSWWGQWHFLVDG